MSAVIIPKVSTELRELARDVRAIGSGRGATPETFLIDKQSAADRLLDIARQLEQLEHGARRVGRPAA